MFKFSCTSFDSCREVLHTLKLGDVLPEIVGLIIDSVQLEVQLELESKLDDSLLPSHHYKKF